MKKMKKMKLMKKISIVVTLFVVLAMLPACGTDGNGEGDPAPAAPVEDAAEEAAEPDEPEAEPDEPEAEPEEVEAEPEEAAADPYELVVSWWGGAARHDKTLEMIDLYMDRNPNATITSIFAGWADYWTQMATLAAAGNLPDVMLVQLMYLGEYTHRGFIRELDPLVAAGHIDVSNFTSGALSGSSIHGNLMGITFGDTASVLTYNRTLIESVGGRIPTDQMLNSELAELLIELAGLLPEGYYAAEPLFAGVEFMENFMRQHGAYGLTTEAGNEIGFTRELLADWFQFHLDLFEAGVHGSLEVLMDDRGAQFGDSLRGRGRQAIWGTNANQTKIFQATLEDELGMVRVHVADGYVRRYAEVAVCSTWTISANTNYVYEAAHFINAMVNDWDLQYIYDMDIGVPGSTVIQQHLMDGLDMTNPVDRMIYREIEIMQEILGSIEPFHGRPEGYPAIVSSLNSLMDEILFGELTVEEAVEQHFNSMAMLLN